VPVGIGAICVQLCCDGNSHPAGGMVECRFCMFRGLPVKKLASVVAVAALIGTPAFATDMGIPKKAPPPPQTPPVFSWTGCYIGGTVGAAWGRSSYTGTPDGDFPTGEPTIIPNLAAISSGTFHPSSAIGGGEIGCNWQTGVWVVGLEGDGSGWDLSKSSTVTGPGDPFNPGTTLTASTSESSYWLATVRGRLGYAYDNWLFYATAGAAFTKVSYSQAVFFTFSDSTQFGSVGTTEAGWTVGSGVQYALTPHWLIKAEYLYVSFPSQTLHEFNPTFPTFTETLTTNRLTASIVRVGLDYKF
jgi:outer membrane immunogenic protein